MKNLFYSGTDHLFIEQVEGKTYANFSKIEIINHDVNDIISYPISIKIKYISDEESKPLITISSEQSFITYSYENSMITLNIHHDTNQINEKMFFSNITINKFEFPLSYKYNIVNSLCYIKIDNVDIEIDKETMRPIASSNNQNNQLNISVFDNHFDTIPHWIDIYGKDVTYSQENNFLTKLLVKNNQNFGIVVYTCKEETNMMYTGIQFEYELDVKMLIHSRGEKKFIETDKIFAGIFKNINAFNIFGYDKNTMDIELKCSDELECTDLTITDRKLALKICFPKKPKKPNFIDFIFSSNERKKVIHYDVIFPDATFEMKDDQIRVSWNDKDLDKYPINYYDSETNGWKEIKANQFVSQPDNMFIIITMFGYYFISYDEPNINCFIDFDNKNVYPNDVTNFCYLVIVNNSRVSIVQEKEFNPETMVKTCIRLCSEDFDYDYDDESNLWIFSWVPLSEDISYMKPILEKLNKKNLSYFYIRFFKFVRQKIPKANDKESMIKNIIDAYVEKIRIIKKLKYRLVCPIKINDIFQISDHLRELTNFSTQDWQNSLHYFDNNISSKFHKDVIKFTRNEIESISSKDIDMQKVDSISCNFGDSTFQIGTINVKDAKKLNDKKAINLCLQLPYIILKKSLSKDNIYFIYQSLIKYSKESKNKLFIDVFNQLNELVSEKEIQKEIKFDYDKTINTAQCKEQMEQQVSHVKNIAQANDKTFIQQDAQLTFNMQQGDNYQSQTNPSFGFPSEIMSPTQQQISPQMLFNLFSQLNQNSFVPRQDNELYQEKNQSINSQKDTPNQLMPDLQQAMYLYGLNQFSFVPQQIQSEKNQQQNQFSFVPQQIQSENNQQQNQFPFVPQQIQSENNQQQNQFSFIPQQIQSENNQQQNQFSFVPQQNQSENNQQQNQFPFIPQQIQSEKNQQQNQFSFVPQQIQSEKNQQQNQAQFPNQMIFNVTQDQTGSFIQQTHSTEQEQVVSDEFSQQNYSQISYSYLDDESQSLYI